MNQTLEQYFRIYTNYQQDDWYNILFVAEFSYNNAKQMSLKCSPFYANYGHNFTIDLRCKSSTPAVPTAKHLADTIAALHEHLVDNPPLQHPY